MKLKTKFQDEDFELGEVVDATINTTSLVDTHIKLKAKAKRGGEHMFYFSRISELFELFEDYEEPKVAYWIDSQGDICVFSDTEVDDWTKEKQVGNYFSSREEAEKVVERLRAWKRLKDKGFEFIGKTYETDKRFGSIFYKVDEDTYSEDIIGDLDLLFCPEENI